MAERFRRPTCVRNGANFLLAVSFSAQTGQTPTAATTQTCLTGFEKKNSVDKVGHQGPCGLESEGTFFSH